jgi:hypothetical protein
MKNGVISGKEKRDAGKWVGEFEVNLTDKNIMELCRDISLTRADNL